MLVQASIRFITGMPWRRPARLAAPLAIALMVLSAGPASAIVVRLASGKKISYEAVAGAAAPKQFDDFFSNVDYSGGPVMASNTNYVVAWTPSNYGGHTPFQTNYLSGIYQFFTDLAAASGHPTNGDSVSTQYNDAAGHVAAYNSSFAPTPGAGELTDNNPLPPNGCPAAAGGICLTDAQMQAELDSFLTSHGLPRDLAHEYFLLTPPDVASCFDAAGTQCSANAGGGGSGYCAYHSASTTAASFIYANIPDLVGVQGCDPFVTHGLTECPTTCQYDNGPADGVLSAIDHEHAESLTDPQPNNGWSDWSITNGPAEMADKCNADAYADPALVPQNPLPTETPYNYTINSHHYLLQMMWSNQGHSCLHSFSPNGTIAQASFTQTAGDGDIVSFDARASTPSAPGTQYVWQFNDGPGQQTNTFETTSPTTSWSFPSRGAYVVALTVMALDGTSNGTAHTVYAVDTGPTAAFSPPAAVAGLPATFNGGASSDPNPAGAIVTYLWDFGDGTTGSGRTATHTFAAAGYYTVKLTVEDNYFAVASVSENVTVTPTPPTASFTPKSGLARQTIHFRGSGRVPQGKISGFSWSFGDGGRASGRDRTHRYRRRGTYKVTLTVTDSNGDSGSATNRVVIGPSCLVPNVIGRSLEKARRALIAAGCRTGTVRHRGGRIAVRERPAAGTVLPLHGKVGLTL